MYNNEIYLEELPNYWHHEINEAAPDIAAAIAKRITNINHDPAFSSSPLSETKQVRPGETLTLSAVTATDPDGDLITLTKVSGPGEFSEGVGVGTVSGTWSWTASGHDPWRLVGFKATDACGGTDLAYLLIHILQPPHVGSGYVRVVRGGSATTSIYVEDPDSKQLNFSFNSPEKGITAEVVGEEPVREYEDYGQGGRYEQIKVSVDKPKGRTSGSTPSG